MYKNKIQKLSELDKNPVRKIYRMYPRDRRFQVDPLISVLFLSSLHDLEAALDS